MTRTAISFIILFIVLFLVQVLLCNNMILFHVAVPVVFIYFLIRLPLSVSTNWLLTISFLTGFAIDVFSDTPGINSLSCTLLAMIKRPVFAAYTSRDEDAMSVIPGIKTLGFGVYAKYLLTMTLIYCILSFSIEYFSFFNPGEMALRIGSSTLLSFALMLGIDSLMSDKREKRL